MSSVVLFFSCCVKLGILGKYSQLSGAGNCSDHRQGSLTQESSSSVLSPSLLPEGSVFGLVSFCSPGLGAVSAPPPPRARLLSVSETVGSASDLNVRALFPWGSLSLEAGGWQEREFMERPRFLGD